jgi:serine protease Do
MAARVSGQRDLKILTKNNGGKKMISTLRQQQNNRRCGTKTLMAVAIAFLMGGLVLASGLNWTGSSVAEDFSSGHHVTAMAPATIPSSFAQLAEKLSPTVVNVKVTKVDKLAFHGSQIPEGPFGDFFDRFFKNMPQFPENHRTQGAGSGVIISGDGYILTNNHVVEGVKDVTVTLADKQEYKAKVVGCDPKTDLAVLKIEAKKPLPSATLGDSDQLKVGEWVIAIGNPFGLSHTVTSGIVSAKERVIGAGPYDDFIQTDASINPGNSGGPLFNMRGEVVGINTAIIPQGQGIGFAIPVNTAIPLIPQLVSKGKVTRGYLGVSIQSITPELAKALTLNETRGALVGDVVSGGPAEKAGIKRGDVIVEFNGKSVDDSHDLPAMVAATPVGNEATVTVLRNGKERHLDVEIRELQSMEAKKEFDEPVQGKWGLTLQNLTPLMAQRLDLKTQTQQRVVVVSVEPGSPADEAGIQRGDLILEINRTPVKTVDEAMDAIAKADDKDALLLLVQRDQGSLFIAMAK